MNSSKLDRFSIIVAKYAFAVFVILYAIANIFFTVRQYNVGDNKANYLFGLTPINIILIVLGLIALWLYFRQTKFKINNRYFLMAFLALSLLVGLYWIFSNPGVLVEYDDAYNCFKAASYIARGDYGPLGYKSYINTYPHNLTLVSYFLIYTKLFGENATTAIRLVNLAFALVGYLSLYKICDELFNNDKANTILIMLMFMSMQLIFYSFFVYGNNASYSTALLSIYLFVLFYKKEKIRYLALSFVAIVFSVAIKNNSMIIMIAEIIYLFIYIVDHKKWTYCGVIVLLVFSIFMCTTGVVKFWEKRSGNNYDNSLPKICWIAYGLNYDQRHPGGYTNEFEVFHHENDFVKEFTEKRAMEFIDGVLQSFKERPMLIPRFYAQKFLVSFANPEYETFAQYRSLDIKDFNQEIISGNINDVLNAVWDATSSLVAIGLVAYLVKRFKKIGLLEMICGVIVFGGFLFHMFWEVKAIYTYQYFMYLLPYAAYGLMLIFKKDSEVI